MVCWLRGCAGGHRAPVLRTAVVLRIVHASVSQHQDEHEQLSGRVCALQVAVAQATHELEDARGQLQVLNERLVQASGPRDMCHSVTGSANGHRVM